MKDPEILKPDAMMTLNINGALLHLPLSTILHYAQPAQVVEVRNVGTAMADRHTSALPVAEGSDKEGGSTPGVD